MIEFRHSKSDGIAGICTGMYFYIST